MSKRSSYPKMSAKSRTSQSLTPTWSMTPVKSQMHRQAQDIAEPNAVVRHDTAESDSNVSMTPMKSQMHRQAQDIAEPNAVVLHDTAESSKQYSSNTVKPNTSFVSLTGIGPFPDH